MCGIVGSFPADREFSEYACIANKLRGPDQMSVTSFDFCEVGINRLIITGGERSEQPLYSENRNVSVVFNGAIYNYRELIDTHNLSPTNENDGAVICELYVKFGLAFADFLEGMYSIILVDQANKRLVYCVDRVGIKPLYWVSNESGLKLASTVQSFPRPMRAEVSRVPPGIVWSSDGTSRRIKYEGIGGANLKELLCTSVNEQIPEEVNWGCMLSGGVDSSLVTAIASLDRSVRTFSCGMEGAEDLGSAAYVADFVRSDHCEIVVSEQEVFEAVGHVVAATASFEPWTVMGGVGTYLVAKYARENSIRVLLSGEGADELFGGYDEFQDLSKHVLEAVMRQYQADLGVSECLRLDRTTMANSVEARVPFLSTKLISFARALPIEAKIVRRKDGTTERKKLLRECAADFLPRTISQRRKEEFSNGSGISDTIRELAKDVMTKEKHIAVSDSPFFSRCKSLEDQWFLYEWLCRYETDIGTSWEELVQRGIFRQPTSNYIFSE